MLIKIYLEYRGEQREPWQAGGDQRRVAQGDGQLVASQRSYQVLGDP